MSSSVEFADGDRRLLLRDRVTIADAVTLHTEALRASSADGDISVDASDLLVLDTAAAQVLIALQRALAARGHQLVWTGLSESPARHLARGGLLPLLNAATA